MIHLYRLLLGLIFICSVSGFSVLIGRGWMMLAGIEEKRLFWQFLFGSLALGFFAVFAFCSYWIGVGLIRMGH